MFSLQHGLQRMQIGLAYLCEHVTCLVARVPPVAALQGGPATTAGSRDYKHRYLLSLQHSCCMAGDCSTVQRALQNAKCVLQGGRPSTQK